MKTKQYFITLLLFASINCFSQNFVNDNYIRNDCSAFFESPSEEYTEAEDCNRSKKCALEDMENGFFIIYTSGGMTPRSKKEAKRMKNFQERFQVKYHDFACLAPNYNCVKNYNSQVFNYLLTKYRKRWIKTLDKWTIGYSEWNSSINKNK